MMMREMVSLGFVRCALCLCAGIIPQLACAAWPERPIALVVGFAAGGGSDTIARLMAPDITRTLGQQIVIINKPGAGTVIAADYVARATPDGHTLLMLSSGTAIAASLRKNVKFRMSKDFTGISKVASSPIIFSVASDSPMKSMAEFVQAARTDPKGITYGAGGIGTSLHLAALLLQKELGLNLTHVPFKGGSDTLAAVLGHEIQAQVSTPAGIAGQTGRLRLLAVTSTNRFAALPNVPTISETVLPGFDVTAWYALAGPAKLAPHIVEKVNAAVRAALANPETRKRLLDIGVVPNASSAAEAQQYIVSETVRWDGIVRAFKLRAED